MTSRSLLESRQNTQEVRSNITEDQKKKIAASCDSFFLSSQRPFQVDLLIMDSVLPSTGDLLEKVRRISRIPRSFGRKSAVTRHERRRKKNDFPSKRN
ncbi:hypothetical protein GWI33_015795 [Rhynchophorus ferrugineus]|uniref:Uncharacterized protein n=1 Tax=Rhynchophorus ferrugineus TaxID=354439 RepID=A0A834I255_RHYFE|nr:hypothetical protein GWI33_015795 [Rhynchophorus ferrugineus]